MDQVELARLPVRLSGNETRKVIKAIERGIESEAELRDTLDLEGKPFGIVKVPLRVSTILSMLIDPPEELVEWANNVANEVNWR